MVKDHVQVGLHILVPDVVLHTKPLQRLFSRPSDLRQSGRMVSPQLPCPNSILENRLEPGLVLSYVGLNCHLQYNTSPV